MGERAPAVGAAGADASLAQQRAERAGKARAMLGKKGAPSLFKFGFKVVPREEAEGACIRACAARDCGLLGPNCTGGWAIGGVRQRVCTVWHWGQVLLRGPTCAQHVHPSLRQTPCVSMFNGLLFKFDTPYVLANVCGAVPETMSLPSKSVLPNPKKTPAAAFGRHYQNSNLSS